MKKLGIIALALPLLTLAPVHLHGARQDTVVEPVGGARYFLCAAFQTLKYGGLLVGRPDAALVGAIGSGIACGFGW